jgi:hypothetical protein
MAGLHGEDEMEKVEEVLAGKFHVAAAGTAVAVLGETEELEARFLGSRVIRRFHALNATFEEEEETETGLIVGEEEKEESRLVFHA